MLISLVLSLSISLKILSKAACEPSSLRISAGSPRICRTAGSFLHASLRFFLLSFPV